MPLRRDAAERLEAATQRYRDAFAQVQQILGDLDLGSVPSWVFAIDRQPIAKVKEWGDELYEAELHRRRARQAMHSLVELMALDPSGQPPPEQPDNAEDLPDLGTGDLDTAETANLTKLDRFITVMHRARAGGAVYLNGTFEPVRGAPEADDDKATFNLGPERR